jgi:proteasome lid subunit RPN8/RPN11
MPSPDDTFVLGPIVEPSISIAEMEMDESPDALVVHCGDGTLSKIMGHASSYRQSEVFGLLVGCVFKTPSGKVRTIVHEAVPARQFVSSTATYVRVSGAELVRMDAEYHDTFRDQALFTVGWYHSHPGHGIFMSQTDKKNHAMYLKPWQVALVVDPVHKTHGFFAGAGCDAIPSITQKGTSGVAPDAISPHEVVLSGHTEKKKGRARWWWPIGRSGRGGGSE